MLRLSFFILFLLFCPLPSLHAQSVYQLIAAVRQKQASLKSVTYTLTRTDTLVTGHTRQMSGKVQIRADKADRLFGFWFRARQDGLPNEVIYDGRAGYDANDSTKTYTRLTNSAQIRNLLH